MNLLLKNPKNVYAIIVMYSFGMICVALFMEHMMNLEPCILCYMQRGSVILIGLFALLGLLINSTNLINFKLNLYLILVSAFCGIALSLRQLYLQNLPEDLVPSCAPDMEYLFETLPYLEIFILALTGDGNCAEVLWTFLGISIPGWVLIGLIIICSYVIYALIYANEIHSHK